MRRDSSDGVKPSGPMRGSAGLALLIAVWAALTAIRVTGPPDLMDHDQTRPAMYALDVVVNGNWLCQRDPGDVIASKPPLSTWLAALCSLPQGRVSMFTLYLPGAISVLVMALVARGVASRIGGQVAGLFAGMCLLLSWFGARHIGLARSDAVFSACVALGAVAAMRAWCTGRGWTWFWLAASAATLAKGPLGLVLASIGLLAAAWERDRGPTSLWSGRVWAGALLFAAITLGWFGAAYARFGQPLIDKMIVDELIGHAGPGKRGMPGARLYMQPLYFLAYFAPWSVPALIGLWRTWRRPPEDKASRRAARFAACWFLGGLLIFAIGPHQRPDLLLPIIPAAAILAGCEMARWRGGRPAGSALIGCAVVAATALSGFAWYYHSARMNERDVVHTMGVRDLAQRLRAMPGIPLPVRTVGETNTFQFYMGTMDRRLSPEEGCASLAREGPVVVAVRRHEEFLQAARGRGISPIEIARWPETGNPFIVVYTNRPELIGAMERPVLEAQD